jgi:hypothetical protein
LRNPNRTESDPGQEVRKIIDDLASIGLKPEGIAEQILVSPRSIYRWRDEKRIPHPAQLAALRSLFEKSRKKVEQAAKEHK